MYHKEGSARWPTKKRDETFENTQKRLNLLPEYHDLHRLLSQDSD